MSPQIRTLSLVVVCIAGLAAALLHYRPVAPLALATGTYLSPRRALPDFSLIDQNGRAFGPADLRGHWSLMFFGYTNCPDFCPTTLVTLAALDKRLAAADVLRPQVVFMSVDARRDTPAQLAKYVPNFSPNFLGVTALDQPTIEALAARLGVVVSITAKPDGSYTVDHSSVIFVLSPDGKLAAVLTGPFTVDALADDLRRIVAGRA